LLFSLVFHSFDGYIFMRLYIFFELATVGKLSGEYDLYPITTPQLL